MSEIETEEVRLGYATWMADVSETTVPEHLAEFDLWFAEVTKAAYLDGLADGITTARRIADYSRVIPSLPTDPTMPATGPTLAQDGLAGSGGTSGQDEGYEAASEARDAYPADHPQPMTVWTPPTVGFYRVPLPEDRSES